MLPSKNSSLSPYQCRVENVEKSSLCYINCGFMQSLFRKYACFGTPIKNTFCLFGLNFRGKLLNSSPGLHELLEVLKHFSETALDKLKKKTHGNKSHFYHFLKGTFWRNWLVLSCVIQWGYL